MASMPIDRVDALLHVPVGACGTPQGDTTMRESRVMFSPDSRMGSAGSYVSHQHTNNGRAASQEAGAEAPAQALGPAPQGHSHSVKAAAPDASMSITRCVDAAAPQGAHLAPQGADTSMSITRSVDASAPQGAHSAPQDAAASMSITSRRCGSTARRDQPRLHHRSSNPDCVLCCTVPSLCCQDRHLHRLDPGSPIREQRRVSGHR